MRTLIVGVAGCFALLAGGSASATVYYATNSISSSSITIEHYGSFYYGFYGDLPLADITLSPGDLLEQTTYFSTPLYLPTYDNQGFYSNGYRVFYPDSTVLQVDFFAMGTGATLTGIDTYAAYYSYDYGIPPAPPISLGFDVPFSFAYVPEPGTWALMLVGLGAMGAALRDRRRLRSDVVRASLPELG